MNRADMIITINKILNRVILENMEYDWNEDYITREWLKAMRTFIKSEMFVLNNEEIFIDWDAFKLSGKIEQDHGDVGMLVSFIDENEEEINGVGFIEAKRRYVETGKWGAINKNQGIRELEKTKHPIMLLYDYEYNKNIASRHNEVEVKLKSFMYSLPLDLIYFIKHEKEVLEKYSNPFAVQLVDRFFRGYDLQFDYDTMEDFGDYINRKFGKSISYVVTVTISKKAENLKKNKISIKDKWYSRIEDEPPMNQQMMMKR